MKNKNLGFIAVIISAIIFGSMPLLAKLIYLNGGNAVSLIFYRFFLSLPILYWLVKKNNTVDIKVTKVEIKNLLLVSIFGYSPTALLLFISYNYISSGIATTLHFVYPIFVVIGSIIFYKDKPSLIKIICVFFCTVGVVLFSKNTESTSLFGIAAAFISGITYSFYILFIDKSNLRNMHPFKLTFYICLISSVIVFIYSLLTKTFTTDITLLGWVLTILLSILSSVGAVSLFQYGIMTVGSQNTAIFSTFEPITSVIIGIMVFYEVFTLRTFIGSIFILAAVVITALSEGYKVKAKRFIKRA